MGGGYGEEVIERVRERVSIVGVIGEHVKLKKAGKNYTGLCPFHEERTPSFTVSPDKQMFYCFGCQAGGNVFNFLMKRENLTFPEALQVLARRAGVPLPEPSDPEVRRRESERAALLAAVEAAAQHFEQALCGAAGAKARAYLERRGIAAETRAAFRLGYAPPAWSGLVESLGRNGIKPQLLERAGLALRERDGGFRDRFRDRLMFPIADGQGRVIGFGGRALDEANQPKYLNSAESPLFAKRRCWYGLHRARAEIGRRELAVVVEGYLDLVTAHQAGFAHVLASLGTALTSDQAMALSRLAPVVVIAYDADAAGAAATLRGLDLFRRFGSRVLVATLPAGLDPDALIRERGGDAFSAALDGALPLLEYRLRRETEGRDFGQVEDRVAAVKGFVPALAAVDDAVEREGYLALASSRLGVSEEALRTELARYVRWQAPAARAADRMATRRNNIGIKQNLETTPSGALGDGVEAEAAAARSSRVGAGAQAEREVLRLMLQDEGLAHSLRPTLSPQDFGQPQHRRLAEALFGTLDAGGGSLAARVTAALSAEDAGLVGGLALEAEGAAYPDPARAAVSLVRRVKEQGIRRRIEELQRAIGEAERRGEQAPAAGLAELQALLQQVKGSRAGEAPGRGETGG